MIKVLKDGHGDFKEAFCRHCGCEFTYQMWDVDAPPPLAMDTGWALTVPPVTRESILEE